MPAGTFTLMECVHGFQLAAVVMNAADLVMGAVVGALAVLAWRGF